MNAVLPVYLSAPGLVCCAGSSRGELYSAALRGDQSGIQPHRVSLVSNSGTSAGQEQKVFLAGICPQGNLPSLPACSIPAGVIPAESRLFKIAAAALEQIRPDVEAAVAAYGPERVGVCAGSCDNGSEISFPAHHAFFTAGTFPNGYDIRRQGASPIAEFIAAWFNLKGPVFTVATACASSAGAIIKGAELIESGLCDAVIAGGADLVSDTVLLGFAALEAVSDEICNPFSKNRKGITLGEGAAFFVLNKNNGNAADFAERQAVVELLGRGESADAHHMTAPRPDGTGAAAAMREALESANLRPAAVDYINLHGTGTPLNDSMEAAALQSVFGGNIPPVSSTKPITGHTLGAAGAIELALCWMAIAGNSSGTGHLPAHCWDGEADSEMPPLNFAEPSARAGTPAQSGAAPAICMSNSFAFGGCNTSLVIGRKDR